MMGLIGSLLKWGRDAFGSGCTGIGGLLEGLRWLANVFDQLPPGFVEAVQAEIIKAEVRFPGPGHGTDRFAVVLDAMVTRYPDVPLRFVRFALEWYVMRCTL